MKIAVIGIGYLGIAVVEELNRRGHQLRLIDSVAPSAKQKGIGALDTELKYEFVQCDVTHQDCMELALRADPPFDAVYTTVGYGFEASVLGDYYTLTAAKNQGIPKVVMVGSEASRGQRIPNPLNIPIHDEDTPALPDYSYGLHKYLIEIIAEYFWRIEGVRTVVLRNGWFGYPRGRTVQQMGEALLIQRAVTKSDMVSAAVLALENADLKHEVFLLSNSTEFSREDLPVLRTDIRTVVDKYYGEGATDFLKEHDVDLLKYQDRDELSKLDDISKAGKLLGWKPTFTFGDFYKNLKAGKYPKDYLFFD